MKLTRLSTLLLALALAAPSAPARSRPAPPQGEREPAVPRPRGRAALLLPRRHGVGALPPAEPRGGGPLPAGSRAEGLHRGPGGGARRARRALRPQPLRSPAPPRQRPRAAGREGGPRERLLGPRRLRGREGQRARPLRRLPAHVGRQVEQEVGQGPRDLHRGERGRLRGVARSALPGPRGDLDPRRRSAGGDGGPRGDPAGDGARAAEGRRRGPPHRRSTRRAGAARRCRSTTRTGSTSTCGRTATSPSSRAATTRRAPTTTVSR